MSQQDMLQSDHFFRIPISTELININFSTNCGTQCNQESGSGNRKQETGKNGDILPNSQFTMHRGFLPRLGIRLPFRCNLTRSLTSHDGATYRALVHESVGNPESVLSVTMEAPPNVPLYAPSLPPGSPSATTVSDGRNDTSTSLSNILKPILEGMQGPESYMYKPNSNYTDEIVVAPLLTAINTADVNTIQGVYPVKPSFPSAVPGSEFVGQVVHSTLPSFEVGSLVIPTTTGLGACRTQLPSLPLLHFTPVSSFAPNYTYADIPDLLALQVNPSTAYLMLRSFVDLQPEDKIIVTAARSAVATAAACIATKKYGAKVIGTCRRKELTDEEWSDEVERLKSTYSYDDILADEDVIKMSPRKLPQSKLILDCVLGPLGSRLILSLKPSGTHVTYGGLSLQPLSFKPGSAIFNDISLKGFWLTRWMRENVENDGPLQLDRLKMLSELWEMRKEGSLVLPSVSAHKLKDWREAISNVGSGEKTAIDVHDFFP